MESKNYSFQDLTDIIARLRSKEGCPWDRVQTHESLKNCMIEEAYEVVEGIDIYSKTKDDENLCEELGDVLLQVLMHSEIAKEEGRFSIQEVMNVVSEKMIRRHPHVFGDSIVDTPEGVIQNWEEIKKKEKKETTASDSVLGVARALPANIRAEKVQKKAAKVGFDFESYEQVLDKVYEELEELKEARQRGDISGTEEEFGDLMFTVVNLSRFLQLNAENSLTNATDKFINRFVDVEKIAISEDKQLNDLSIDELNALWGRVK